MQRKQKKESRLHKNEKNEIKQHERNNEKLNGSVLGCRGLINKLFAQTKKEKKRLQKNKKINKYIFKCNMVTRPCCWLFVCR